MSNNYIKLAQTYSKAGFSVIPVSVTKIPTIREWREYQNRPMTSDECEKYFDNAHGIALLCGGKNHLTAIDMDLKNDLSGDLYERFKKRVPNNILKKMYVQKTQNGGYHFVFSCPDKIEPNQKFASRFTTADERHQVYIENFENPLTKDKALKIASNYISLVTIESRGEGGYICIAPTKGYEHVYGKINQISKEEYEILTDICREFNEVSKVIRKDSRIKSSGKDWKISPFQDFNNRGDVIQLLMMNGWKTVGRTHGKNIRLKRPGKSSTSSALFDTSTMVFTCFSTSTEFDANKGYSPSDLYIDLECDKDVGKAFLKLVEEGYGVK